MPALKLSSELPFKDKDKELGLTCKIKVLNGNEPRSAMGLIADTFRQMEDVAVGEGRFRNLAIKWYNILFKDTIQELLKKSDKLDRLCVY